MNPRAIYLHDVYAAWAKGRGWTPSAEGSTEYGGSLADTPAWFDSAWWGAFGRPVVALQRPLPLDRSITVRAGVDAPASVATIAGAAFGASDLVEEIVLTPAGVRIVFARETDPEVFDDVLDALQRTFATTEGPYR